MPFQLFVALRYLRAKRKQTVVSVISAISALAIAAGVMALVIALALSTGFRDDIQEKIVGATSHVNLLRVDNGPLGSYKELLAALERLPHVTGAAPAIFNQVFIVSPYRSQGGILKGVDAGRVQTMSEFFLHIVAEHGRPLDPRPPEPADPAAPPSTV